MIERENGFGIHIGSIKAQQSNIGQNVTATQNIYNKKDNDYLDDEVLHIIGEAAFGISDGEALKNAGVKTVVIDTTIKPYYDLFLEELERQRSDNKVIKLLHFSGHGDVVKGLLFGNEWVNWQILNDALTPYDELEVIFIAACSTIKVADAISGKFKYVLASVVDVPNSDAITATEIFWKNIVRGKSPTEAFESVKLNVPHFAPNLRLRGL